jgi:amino acid transporter
MHDNNSLTATNRASNPDALLSRDLGTRQLAANIFNYTVGTGIFVLPATAVAALGAAAPLAYVVCAIIIGLVVLCFAEAGSRVTTTGGAYAYVEVSLGPMMGFVAGCLVLATGTSAAAFAASAVSKSILALFPGTPFWLTYALILVLVAALVAINWRGVRLGSRVTEVATVAKLFPLLAFVAIGVFFIDPANLVWTSVPTSSAVLGSAGVVIYAFSGIEGSLVPSGEVKNPSRSVPRAAFLALGAATLLYIAIQFVALGILGQDLATDNSPVPLANAAERVAGSIGKTILIAGGVVSMFGYLSANVLSEPRGLFAFSRDRFLPSTLSAVHPTYRTPHRAILLYGLVVAIIALTDTALGGTFQRLAIFANLAALILYSLCAVAAWNLRRRNIRTESEPFVTPGGPLVPIAACLSIAWLFSETVNRQQLIALLILLAIIFALYAIRTMRLRMLPK